MPILYVCAWCPPGAQKVRFSQDVPWILLRAMQPVIASRMQQGVEGNLSHGFCPDCADKMRLEISKMTNP